MLRAAALFLWGARGGLPAGGGQTALAELRTTKKALGRYFVVGFR